jgi:rhodanese-related sulfurtransferase
VGVRNGSDPRCNPDADGRDHQPCHAELDPDAPIVVLCHHGARSLSVTMWLREQGFEKAQSLAGGIDHWSRVIDPSVPRY